MASRWAFQVIQDTVRNAGLVFMSDSFYGRQFELSPTRFDYDLGHEGSSTYRLSRSTQLFRPVIFGEVKEITGELSRHAITINLGLPQWAPHETDTLFWNQVAELGYTMRRESADNDTLTYMLPYEDHLPIHQIIPWSIGPNGDSWDRIFIQVAADCPYYRYQLLQTRESGLEIYSPRPPVQSQLPTNYLGHRLGDMIMNTGANSRDDVAGSWVQPCFGCGQARCKKPSTAKVFVITPALPADILNQEPLRKLFESRAELHPGRMTLPAPSSTPASLSSSTSDASSPSQLADCLHPTSSHRSTFFHHDFPPFALSFKLGVLDSRCRARGVLPPMPPASPSVSPHKISEHEALAHTDLPARNQDDDWQLALISLRSTLSDIGRAYGHNILLIHKHLEAHPSSDDADDDSCLNVAVAPNELRDIRFAAVQDLRGPVASGSSRKISAAEAEMWEDYALNGADFDAGEEPEDPNVRQAQLSKEADSFGLWNPEDVARKLGFGDDDLVGEVLAEDEEDDFLGEIM
ncbi:hypothetical protein B0H10DRAFT_2245931 [Mycena sp. CBHHK59/15]|nr:hypothetical protein B0H10DRAFT_2245931 [Mycena sp. CBHHK59/15]